MRIGLVSDLHWMREPPTVAQAWHGDGELAGVLDRLAAALGHFADQGADRIVVAGDLSHHGDVESMIDVLRALGNAPAPVVLVAGNHDITDDPERLAQALTLAETPRLSLAGPEGVEQYGLQVAGVHVGESDGWFRARLRGMPVAGAWGSRPLVLISHYPVLSLATEVATRGLPYPGDVLERERLAEMLLARSAPAIVLGGHLHVRATRAAGPVLQLTAGALAEPPYECALIDIERSDDGALSVQRRCLRLLGEPGPREPVFAPEHEAWDFDGARWIESVPVAPTTIATQR
jgi:predicted phosphodiesterase